MSLSPPGRGMTSRAPQASVPKISPIDTSKLGEATCSSRSSCVDPVLVGEPDEVLGDRAGAAPARPWADPVEPEV